MTLPQTHLTVKPEWIDHNGHMNVAFYVLAFDQATDQVYETWGLGLDYPDREKCSIFTIGMNVDYHNEAFQDDPLCVKTQLVDMDCKRIHYVHSMYHATGKQLLARNECLCMTIALAPRRRAPFPPPASAKTSYYREDVPLRQEINCRPIATVAMPCVAWHFACTAGSFPLHAKNW